MDDATIERVARALCRFDGNPENAKFEGALMWRSYIDQARIAIDAMESEPGIPVYKTALDPNPAKGLATRED